MELNSLNSKIMRRAVILEKPSGTIAIAGNLDKRQRKFYNGLLYNAKQQLLKNINVEQFTISLNTLKETLDVSEDDKNNNYYKKLIKELYDISIEYNVLKKDKQDYETAHLLDNVGFETDFTTKEVKIRYTIPLMIKKSILKTIKGDSDVLYATINLVIIRGLKSKYSIILYEICKDYEKVEIPKMSMEQFKKIFGIENKKAYNFSNGLAHIKQRILNPAIEEINENKDIDFMVDYQLLKQGNTYTHIKFIVTPKPKQKQLEQYKENSQTNILINSIPAEHRTKQLEIYLSKCLKDYDAKYLLHQIEYVNSQKPKNYFAYLKKAIIEDYANNEKAIIEEKKEAIKQKYQEQIKRIRKLKEEKGMVKLRERQGNIFYFSDASFNEDHLVIYEDVKAEGEFYSNTVNVKEIPISDEKTIQELLNEIEKILSEHHS